MKLDMNNYQKLLKGISIVEVSGSSCANCFSLLPVLNQIVQNRKDCVLHYIEVSDETKDLVKLFNIEAVPTILVMKDCEVFARCRGYQPLEILEIWIDAKIEELKSSSAVKK